MTISLLLLIYECAVCVCVYVCVQLHSFSSEWDTNEIHISKEHSNRLDTPQPLAEACRTSSVQTLALSDPICTNMRSARVPPENRTHLWLKGMNAFSFCQHAYNNCASWHACVCVCVCVPSKAASPLFTYPGYQANSVVSNTSGTTQRRRVNDVRAIDALNCEAFPVYATTCLLEDQTGPAPHNKCPLKKDNQQFLQETQHILEIYSQSQIGLCINCFRSPLSSRATFCQIWRKSSRHKSIALEHQRESTQIYMPNMPTAMFVKDRQKRLHYMKPDSRNQTYYMTVNPKITVSRCVLAFLFIEG